MTDRIVVTRRPPGRAPALLESAFPDIVWWPENRPMPRDHLLDTVAEATGLYCMLTDRIDAELLGRAPHLRVVSQMAVGVDNVDLAACRASGVRLGHTPDVLTETTADLAMTLMLSAARRISEGANQVKEGTWGDWDPGFQLGRDVHGARLGIIGMGRVGLAVAKRAGGFGMDIAYHNRRPHPDAGTVDARPVGFEDLLRRSDFVVLCCPLTEATYRLIDAAALTEMRAESILVNVARGPVVDTEALVEVLESGGIFGAALDVTDPEPLPAGHPLLGLSNCLVVPHIGSATVQARAAMAELAAQNLIDGLAGRAMPAEHPATVP